MINKKKKRKKSPKTNRQKSKDKEDFLVADRYLGDAAIVVLIFLDITETEEKNFELEGLAQITKRMKECIARNSASNEEKIRLAISIVDVFDKLGWENINFPREALLCKAINDLRKSLNQFEKLTKIFQV